MTERSLSRRGALILSACGLVAFLALWQGLGWLGLMNPKLAPPPSVLPAAFAREFASGHWVAAVKASLYHYGLGLVIGSTLGITFGMAAGISRRFEAAQLWVVRVLRPIPTLAWIPFAILWFGVSESAAIYIIAIYVFWINYYAAFGAVRAVDPDLLELARAFGHGSRMAQIVKIVLPAAFPGIVTGVRTSIGQGWMAVVAAELFGVPGLGARMMEASGLLATPVVLLYMVTIAALYGVTDAVYGLVTGLFLTWQR